jgi:predicted metalloprotease with PDZ domain
MRYTFSYTKAHQQLIDIVFEINNIAENSILVRLPRWRPGRYELGNFAKNIQSFNVFNEKDEVLFFTKTEKDAWLIHTNGAKSVKINYRYYAAELNAGSSFLAEDLFYINPVNCCLYVPERMNETCELNFNIPNNFKIASGLKKVSENKYEAQDFQQLADCPVLAAKDLAHNFFIYEGIEFHIWIKGLEKPDWSMLLSDFFLFTHEQYEVFKSFPVKEYHYLFIFLPYKFHHGVEHQNSTVIVMGPKYDIFKEHFYNEVLGVSSHELFHTWNIKAIRPKEMLPYDFSKENYSRLGFVYEGLTTYYGDLMLYRSRVFSQEEYFETFNKHLQKHFDNFGRYYLSVADSSFDTWLDGYVNGIPNRKVSIYTEGCLLAFATDILIRKYSDEKYSLDDVCRYLYQNFALKNVGYTYEDYKGICEHYAGRELTNLFENYISGTKDYQPLLDKCLDYIGLTMNIKPSPLFHQSKLGIKVTQEQGKTIVYSLYPNSVADRAGIAVGDEIKSVESFAVTNNFEDWIAYFVRLKYKKIHLGIIRQTIHCDLEIELDDLIYYKLFNLKKQDQANTMQISCFNNWAKREF